MFKRRILLNRSIKSHFNHSADAETNIEEIKSKIQGWKGVDRSI